MLCFIHVPRRLWAVFIRNFQTCQGASMCRDQTSKFNPRSAVVQMCFKNGATSWANKIYRRCIIVEIIEMLILLADIQEDRLLCSLSTLRQVVINHEPKRWWIVVKWGLGVQTVLHIAKKYRSSFHFSLHFQLLGLHQSAWGLFMVTNVFRSHC